MVLKLTSVLAGALSGDFNISAKWVMDIMLPRFGGLFMSEPISDPVASYEITNKISSKRHSVGPRSYMYQADRYQTD